MTWPVLYASPSTITTVQQTELKEIRPADFATGQTVMCGLPGAPPSATRVHQPAYTVEKMLLRHGQTLMWSQYKMLKSTVARELSLCVVSAMSFLNEYAIHEKDAGRPAIILIAEEDYPGANFQLWRQAQGLGLSDDVLRRVIFVPVLGRQLFGRTKDVIAPTTNWRAVEQIVKKVQPALVACDTLIGIKGAAKENSNDDMHAILELIQLMAREYETTALVLDHEGHALRNRDGTTETQNRPRGGSAKPGDPTDLIDLKSHVVDGNEDLYYCTFKVRHRYGPNSTRKFHVGFTGKDGPIYFTGPNTPLNISMMDKKDRRCVQLVGAGDCRSKSALKDALSVKSQEGFEGMLYTLRSLVAFEEHGAGKPAVPYLTEAGRAIYAQLGALT